jgi:hypothetical protein
MNGKLTFVTQLFGSDPEWVGKFLNGANIDHGLHPESDRRVTVFLSVVHFVLRVTPTEEQQTMVDAWLDEPAILLGGLNPVEYLIGSDVFSESLWIEVAMSCLRKQAYIGITDDFAAELLAAMCPAVTLLEEDE